MPTTSPRRRVRFTTASKLVNELVEARQEHELSRIIRRYARFELLCIDELGYVPLADVGAELLFQVISERRCLRCLLLVMCTYPFAKKALTLHLACGEGRERYFGCNLMQRKVLASSHQHLMAEAPVGYACAFYLFIRQPMGRKSALRREIPWILRGFQGRLSC